MDEHAGRRSEPQDQQLPGGDGLDVRAVPNTTAATSKVMIIVMFSRAGPAAGNANRPRAFITAAPVPATEYNAIWGTNSRRTNHPGVPLCLCHARVGDRSREHPQQEGPGCDQHHCQDRGRQEDAAEEPACEVSCAVMVTDLVASDDRRNEDRSEQRPGEKLVVEEVRDRVERLIRVAQVGRAEHRSDGDALPQPRRPADDRPDGTGQGVAEPRWCWHAAAWSFDRRGLRCPPSRRLPLRHRTAGSS